MLITIHLYGQLSMISQLVLFKIKKVFLHVDLLMEEFC